MKVRRAGGCAQPPCQRTRRGTALSLAPPAHDQMPPPGEILYSYNGLDPDKHVANTMAALKKCAEEHKAKSAL